MEFNEQDKNVYFRMCSPPNKQVPNIKTIINIVKYEIMLFPVVLYNLIYIYIYAHTHSPISIF